MLIDIDMLVFFTFSEMDIVFFLFHLHAQEFLILQVVALLLFTSIVLYGVCIDQILNHSVMLSDLLLVYLLHLGLKAI